MRFAGWSPVLTGIYWNVLECTEVKMYWKMYGQFFVLEKSENLYSDVLECIGKPKTVYWNVMEKINIFGPIFLTFIS